MKKRILGIAILFHFFSVVIYVILKLKKKNSEIQFLSEQNNKMRDDYYLLNHWIELKNFDKNISTYFEEMGYKRIAIYGMAELANRFMEDLNKSDIKVIYGIDRDVSCTITRLREVYSPEGKLPESDVIVVMPYYAFQTIRKELQTKVTCPIISIEDVVWSI